jgi:hypothetical protein
LRQVIRPKPGEGRKYIDKLAQVHLKGGGKRLLYIHVEVQNDVDEHFPRRMFIYHYRLFEKFGERVWTLAVLGDTDPNWRPKRFHYGLYGCSNTFKFPVTKLLDYEQQWERLERSRNPFALVVMAHLKAKRTLNKPEERARWKFTLLRLALARKSTQAEIQALLKVIDWMIDLPPELDKRVDRELQIALEGEPMAYITHWERNGEKKGVKKGVKKGKMDGMKGLLATQLQKKFGQLPDWARERLDSADPSSIEKWGCAILQKGSLEEVFAAS